MEATGEFWAEGSCDPSGMTKGPLWLLCGKSLQGESRVEVGKLVAGYFNVRRRDATLVQSSSCGGGKSSDFVYISKAEPKGFFWKMGLRERGMSGI